ncbi:hypothetical protein G3R49_10225 [Shewanella sp. WXL01]|nr:hypothetical protein [Shewanella sp. WXL01]
MRYKMKKSLLALALAVGVAAPTFAEDKQPDPSDLTAVNSFAFATVDDQGKIQGMVGVAGAYSEGNNFIGLVEHGVSTKTTDNGHKAQNSRLRYFQVIDTGSAALPQAGFSVDYMKGWAATDQSISTDIVALGAIAKVTTPWEAVSIFPNLAYVTGSAESTDPSIKADIKGYQVNLFGSIALDEAGKYLVIQPQFMSVDVEPKGVQGKGEANVFKVKTGFGMPISADGLWWTELSHTYTRTDAAVKAIDFTGVDNDNKFEIGVSYYF